MTQFNGIAPKQEIEEMVRSGTINAADGICSSQYQPASIDLRLGQSAHRVHAGFLPGKTSTVRSKLRDFTVHTYDLSQGAVLEANCVYLVELKENLKLPQHIAGKCNPKSTTGRLDVFCRVLTDYCENFDIITDGYHGPVWLEITPRTFPIKVRSGDTLSQLRLRRGDATIKRTQIIQVGLDAIESPHEGDNHTSELVGYRARKHSGVIDLSKVNSYEVRDFWDPVFANSKKRLVLEPDAFYILASRQRIIISRDEAAEMAPSDAGIGEFRAHYAGFFDPGFGGTDGARAVLEVRSRDLPFVLEDGQAVALLHYEPLMTVPSSVYGDQSGSNYYNQKKSQELRLAKQFRIEKTRRKFPDKKQPSEKHNNEVTTDYSDTTLPNLPKI